MVFVNNSGDVNVCLNDLQLWSVAVRQLPFPQQQQQSKSNTPQQQACTARAPPLYEPIHIFGQRYTNTPSLSSRYSRCFPTGAVHAACSRGRCPLHPVTPEPGCPQHISADKVGQNELQRLVSKKYCTALRYCWGEESEMVFDCFSFMQEKMWLRRKLKWRVERREMVLYCETAHYQSVILFLALILYRTIFTCLCIMASIWNIKLLLHLATSWSGLRLCGNSPVEIVGGWT